MKTFDFRNEYLYVIFRVTDGNSPVIYCAGVNIRRFKPLTFGRHGNASNPAHRGVQLLRMNVVVPAAIEAGGRVVLHPYEQSGDVPRGESWFRECFAIHGVGEEFVDGIFPQCVHKFVRMILGVCFPSLEVPDDKLSDPVALQAFLDSLASAS
ncbi:MAG: hypothetical protein HZA20_14300 [Nitrospirae bacterium]|nr:hypothetical protein [Nitrospirota bacterium]